MATLAQIDLTREGALFGLPMPLTLRTPVAMSDEDLMAFSHRNRLYRIERNAQGELEIMSPVGFEGGQREIYVGSRLFDWAEEHGGVVVSSNAGFKLADEAVRSPDASWVSDNRINALNDVERRGFAPLCPDFLVQILSESDSRAKLEEKMEMWIANGAHLAWMIDPFAAEVLIYRPGREAVLLVRPDWVEAEAVVPCFRLETSRLWAK